MGVWYVDFFSRTTVSISNKPLYSFNNMFNKPIFAAAAATVVVVLNRNGDGINVSINFCKKDNNSHGDNNVFN